MKTNDYVRAMWLCGACVGWGCGGAAQKFLGEPWVTAGSTGLVTAMLISLLYLAIRRM